MYFIFDSVNKLDGSKNRGWLKSGTVQGYHHMAELLFKTICCLCSKRFSYIWYKHSDICSCKLYWQYLCRSWWSSGMIPEKVTWVQFLARINTVCSKLLPMNNLFFQYLIKHSYIFALMNFLTEYQITKYVQLCCISFATFFEFFHFFFML